MCIIHAKTHLFKNCITYSVSYLAVFILPVTIYVIRFKSFQCVLTIVKCLGILQKGTIECYRYHNHYHYHYHY